MREPEKYNFAPKELLTQICTIYLNLESEDGDKGALTAAIAADGRSYREEMFAEASAVARQFHLMTEGDVARLERLGSRVQEAAQQGGSAFRVRVRVTVIPSAGGCAVRWVARPRKHKAMAY